MRRIPFNPRFVNEAGNDLIPGKIHTVRQNFEFWKKFEGQCLELYIWEGKPYQSKQKVFCAKRLASVQQVFKDGAAGFWLPLEDRKFSLIPADAIAGNDGFGSAGDFIKWFAGYPAGEMAILHFTGFRY